MDPESAEWISDADWAELEKQAFFGTSGQVYYPIDQAYWNASFPEIFQVAMPKAFSYFFSGLPEPKVNGDEITAIVSGEWITAWQGKFSADGETVYVPIMVFFGGDACSPSAIDDFVISDELPVFTEQGQYRFIGKPDLTGDTPVFDSDYPCQIEIPSASLMPPTVMPTATSELAPPTAVITDSCDIESASHETLITDEELLACLRKSLGIQTPLPAATATAELTRPTAAATDSCDIESASHETLMTDEELLACLRKSLGIQD